MAIVVDRLYNLSVFDAGINLLTIRNYEDAIGKSISDFAPLSKWESDALTQLKAGRDQILAPFELGRDKGLALSPEWNLVFGRNENPKGPMGVFGYDYLIDHLAEKHLPRPKLLEYRGRWGAGEEYAYETLNFVDGKRNAEQIRQAVSTEYGFVTFDLVLEYLKALESIGVLTRVR